MGIRLINKPNYSVKSIREFQIDSEKLNIVCPQLERVLFVECIPFSEEYKEYRESPKASPAFASAVESHLNSEDIRVILSYLTEEMNDKVAVQEAKHKYGEYMTL